MKLISSLATSQIQGRKFQKQEQNLCHQERNIEVRGAILGPPGVGFFNYVSPGGGTCQVMHSGLFMKSCMLLSTAAQLSCLLCTTW